MRSRKIKFSASFCPEMASYESFGIYPYKCLVLEHGFTWAEESSHVLN